ncbi:MAG: serine hydrolase [Eubacteriales bacterium]|nr:serine hydrolase [Eubacteriales bacterium]MDY3332605.1 serine hydrolase [Gallibacter sp.]
MSKIGKNFLLKIIIISVVLTGLNIIFNPIERFELLKYNSKSIYVYNLTDKKEELSLNATEKRAPASLTKIMTTFVALESKINLSRKISIDINSYRRAINNNASVAGFVTNENITFRDLLYGTMLPSGGECANTISNYITLHNDDFIALMNKRVESLGLKNTRFTTADGLDENDQFSTAKDIAIILEEALKDGNFRAIFTKKEYTSTSTSNHPKGLYMESTVFKKLKKYQYNGFEIVGGKSGTTNKAGMCWAILARKNGKEYIVVTMGANENNLDNAEDGQIVDTLKILENL